MIKDSGERITFSSGAVRDTKEDKGRCDLLPLTIIGDLMCDNVIRNLGKGKVKEAFEEFVGRRYEGSMETALLEVSIHFRDGAKKYGEHNWQKGIPLWSFMDSAVRHYLKWLRGDKDEPHDRAFMWNCLAYMWTKEYIDIDITILKEKV